MCTRYVLYEEKKIIPNKCFSISVHRRPIFNHPAESMREKARARTAFQIQEDTPESQAPPTAAIGARARGHPRGTKCKTPGAKRNKPTLGWARVARMTNSSNNRSVRRSLETVSSFESFCPTWFSCPGRAAFDLEQANSALRKSETEPNSPGAAAQSLGRCLLSGILPLPCKSGVLRVVGVVSGKM